MRILVVDDESGIRGLLTRILQAEGHDVITAVNGVEALSILTNLHVDLVLSDVRMPEMDGLELLRRHTERAGAAPFVVMSAYGDDDAAIEAIRNGAHDYMFKPFQPDHVLLVLRKAVERERLRNSVRLLSEELSLVRSDEDVIGRSEALLSVVSVARRAAPHQSSVLITGEIGTGKELMARLIHRNGQNFESAFLAVDCAVPSESLLSGELFATNPSLEGRPGRPVLGTVFLDDVDALSPDAQARLASAVRRMGAGPLPDGVQPPSTRITAATTTDLATAVAAGKFRSDLYYAISVVQLRIPPLRDRSEDVPDLALYFAGSHARRLQRPVPRFSPAALRALSEHPWPGNVRELENVIERAMVLSDSDQIRLELIEWMLGGSDVSQSVANAAAEDLSIKRQTAALEKKLIAIALDRCGGNRIRAAKVLELSHRALLYKIKGYELGG